MEYSSDVTETITKLIVDGISSHSMLLDQYVVLHAAFVSALHKLTGIEFGKCLCPVVVIFKILRTYQQRLFSCSMSSGRMTATSLR